MTAASRSAKSNWQRRLKTTLPLFGHRNWIVVADAAYPAQSRPGIETILSGSSQLETARAVLGAIAAAKHVRASVYLDQELARVAEADAPGVTKYREQLAKLLGASQSTALPHEQIIAKLDQAAQFFRILIIKTEFTIPYTSMFFELDCGYWSAEAEARLRAATKK